MDDHDLIDLGQIAGPSRYAPAPVNRRRQNFQNGTVHLRSQSLANINRIQQPRFLGQRLSQQIPQRINQHPAQRQRNVPVQRTRNPYPRPIQQVLQGVMQNAGINNQPNNAGERPNNRTREMKNRGNRNGSQDSGKRVRTMGFLTLEELAKSDVKDIITNLSGKKEAFSNLLESPVDRPDVFVLVIELLSKICQSSFDQLKLTLLLDVCNSRFINNLRSYLLDLPYPERKSANNSYWKNELQFWKNFIMFCECIIVMSPSTALTKCRSLFEGASKCCLEALKDRHNFELPKEYDLKLNQLRETLTAHEKDQDKKVQQKQRNLAVDEENEPPQSFRELSVVPRREDLIEERPYLRANLIKGSYRDVEHYLDVQFRLLREDCFGPLRDGIIQFMNDPTKKKFDNIRIFRNVKFVESYVSPQKIGSVVEVDDFTKRRFKQINWDHSKRFIFGSLLLFTKDNCNSFIVATILDRDVKYLSKGKIPVSIVEINVDDDINRNDTYTMIESEVYFEPYYHILKVLQDPKFPEQIAMKKYIVDVNPQPSPPAYLTEDTMYTVLESMFNEHQFRVLDLNTWPSNIELKLNESQYEAYKTALTHEFAVIQGPPGTGKTYLGVKVAHTILENMRTNSGCILLLVCYTNHALDQFLEALIPVTESIVRIGGRSRNEAMERFNLNNLRKTNKLSHNLYKLFSEQRDLLRSAILKLQRAQADIDSINSSIISYNCLREYCTASNAIGNIYKRIVENGKDPLCYWLFKDLDYNFDEPITDTAYEIEQNNDQIEVANDDDDDNRHEVILDDLEIDLDESYGNSIQKAFSFKDSNLQLMKKIAQYITCKNAKQKYDLHVEIIILRTRIRLFEQMKELYFDGLHIDQNNVGEDLENLPIIDRWMLYFSWTKFVTNELKTRILPLQESVRSCNTAYEETRMLTDYKILRNVRVVGMTTSGAARLRKLVQVLAPPIVIVEEAAEVLEQHIVTSLTKSCQHLILIGDHQQLRPSAAHMRLARHFNLEVSLFERMILNALHSRRLAVQHRMRPQISALISPHIYADLQDHPSVTAWPDVRGVTANVFFFTHDWKEEVVDDTASKSNIKEADMVLGLANYIMQQGYEPEDVTILAAYSGQMFYLRKQRQRYAHLAKVKITVVDNYQGEESKIILLSLVRNNDANKIGFLGTENRICVALSRAKEGFYMMGNIDILKQNSTLWTKIAATLESQCALGTSIRLKCENHSNQISTISSLDDFRKVPEGGCLLKCNYNLPCLHACPLVCHSYDRGHVEIKCSLACERIICDLNHVCPLMCRDKCKPCMRMVKKKLPCGHEKEIFCYLDPENPSIKCLVTVPAKLPNCGHEVKKSCYMDVKKMDCPVPCMFRVEKCGHVCMRRCHVTDDPDHEKYLCPKPCIKAKKGCTMELEGDLGDHQCRKKCHELCDDCNVEVVKKRSSCKHKERVACSRDADDEPCRRKCARTLPCGHFCNKKCFEPCGDCKIKVKKVIPDCGHEVKLECEKKATRSLCESDCERTLPCRHRCRQRCCDPCDWTKCTQTVPQWFNSPCGHKVQLPCNVYTAQNGLPSVECMLQACRWPCGVELACGHVCAGDCASCLRGRLHVPCGKRCNAPNICGHDCEEPCSQLCPPCNKPCEVKCEHGRCPRPCGAPCVPCQEACGRGCAHGRCSRRCGEACSRGACALACARRLACGHVCRGLCGERCPDACKLCRPADFPVDVVNLGDEFDDDAVFIVLEDCGHILEFSYVEYIMNTESETVSLKACPLCRKPIINTPRYKNLVNEMFKTDINPIKKKVYGDEMQIVNTKKKLVEVISNFLEKHYKISNDILYAEWKKAFKKVSHFVTTNKRSSLLQLNMHFISLNILEMLSEIYKKFTVAKLKELDIEFIYQNSIICRVISANVKKLSQQQQLDIGNEMKRMSAIVQLSKILSHHAYIMNKHDKGVNEAKEYAKGLVLGCGIYDEDKAKKALETFQTAVKVSGIVTKEERDLIIKAIGAKAGQWYKCPNGHFYSIDRCGGAMERSKCLECKAVIGGENHRLVSDNAHAPEIDNSRYAAWSEEANNMANFDFDNLL